MKQISTLFDALRSEKFAIAVRDEYGLKYYCHDGQGKEWAKWANSVETKSLEESHIPAGIIQGPFKNISDTDLKSLITSFGYADSSIDNFIKSKSYWHLSSVRTKSASITPAVLDTPINYFTANQYNSVIAYKCLSLRQNIKEASFVHEANVNRYAFNFEKFMYTAGQDNERQKSLRQRADSFVGRSTERRMGLKIKSALLSDGLRTKVGAVQTLETKSLISDISVKEIGQSIGSGSRVGRRALRAATTMFDPKAWDGDGDGIVQEGTPYERPAIPGINDRATGGHVDVAAATRAWEKLNTGGRDKPFDSQNPLNQRLGSGLGWPEPSRRRVSTGITPGRTPSRGTVSTGVTPGRTPSRGRISTGITPGKMPSSGRSVLPRSQKPAKPEVGSLSRRISDSRVERQITGFASRSGSKVRNTKPGIDKVSEADGAFHEGLSDAEKATVKSNLQKRYQEIQDRIKNIEYINDPGRTIWDVFLGKKGNKTDADGKPWSRDSRAAGEFLTSAKLDVENILDEIQGEIDDHETQKEIGRAHV